MQTQEAPASNAVLPSDNTSVIPGRSASTSSRRLQLDYIDGMRALAALYIVVVHALAVGEVFNGPKPLVFRFFGHGQEVVAVFLAISGFCLALPQAQRAEWRVETGRFLRRRAQRILPPYYAAIVVAIGFHIVQARYGSPFPFSSLWLHCLLLQNWVPAEMYTLDGPLWSVALELQVYLLFPLLVLARRRTGPFVTLAIAILAGFGSMKLLHNLGETVFVAFFGIGIFFSEAAFRPEWRRFLPWCMALSAAAALSREYVHLYIPDFCWAIFAGALMAYLAPAHRNPVRRLLSWKPLVFVGVFSYSIYLIHSLFTETAYQVFHSPTALPGDPAETRGLITRGCIAAAASLPVAYLFHRCFELPFMSVKRQKVETRVLH